MEDTASLRAFNGYMYETVETGPLDVVLADGERLSVEYGFAVQVRTDDDQSVVPCGFGALPEGDVDSPRWNSSNPDHWALVGA